MRYYRKIFAENDRMKQLELALLACEVYETEYDSAKAEIHPKGRVESVSAKIAGMMEHRWGQLQDLESILEHLENYEGVVKQKRVIFYSSQYQKTLSDAMAKAYADADDEVQDIRLIRHRVANVRNQFLGIIKSIDILNWQVSNCVKLRTAGLEDATL